MIARIPRQRRDPQFRQRRGLAALRRKVVITPDYTIRTKNAPLIVPPPEAGKLDGFKQDVARARRDLHRELQAYFARHNARVGGGKTHARSAAARRAGAGPRPVRARPLQEGRAHRRRSRRGRVETITDAEAIGRFKSISEADMFDIEYWSIEQAKLGKAPDLPLAGQVAVDHRRRRRDRRCDGKGVRRGRRRGRAARHRSKRPRRERQGDRRRCARDRMRRHRRASVHDALRQGRPRIRRRRHPGLERRRGLAGPHRRSRRGDAAQKLRAEFLRPSARRAGRREDHAGSRAPAAACCSTCRSRR